MVLVRITIVAILIVTICACTAMSGLGIPKSEVQFIDANFSGTFTNECNDKTWPNSKRTITELFQIADSVHVDYVQLNFFDSTHLQITCYDSLGMVNEEQWVSGVINNSQWIFKGEFVDGEYFLITLHEEYKYLLVYNKESYRRLRIGLNTSNQLVIYHYGKYYKYFWGKTTESEFSAKYMYEAVTPETPVLISHD